MTNRTTRFSALVAALLFVGCGGDATRKEEIGEKYIESICDLATRCPDSGFEEVAVLANLFESGTPGSCEQLLRSAGFIEVPSELEGVDEGTIVYNGGSLDRCLRRLVQECVPFEGVEYLEECRGIFVGQLGVGETCRIDSECEPGTYCDTDLTCSGTCAPQLTLGAACDDDEQCPAEGDALGDCDSTDANPEPHCTLFEVRTGAALGEPCGQVEGEISSYTACRAGLYCRYAGDTPTCAEPVASGGACTEDDRCLNGYCDDGICRTGTLRTAAGETCDLSNIFCDGSRHLGCSEGVCVEVGDGTLGAPCTLEDDPYLPLLTCDDGLYCNMDLDTPACATLKVLAAPCESGAECETGVCDDGVCAEYGPICGGLIEI